MTLGCGSRRHIVLSFRKQQRGGQTVGLAICHVATIGVVERGGGAVSDSIFSARYSNLWVIVCGKLSA